MRTTLLLLMLMCSVSCFGQHRKHVLGTMYLSYPPIYKCQYCPNSASPYNLSKDCRTMDGYTKFVKELRKKGINSDSFFIVKWNETDTSCISSEIAWNKVMNKPKKKQ